MAQLSGKVALITGAKGGLGSSVTPAFLSAGAAVAGVARNIQASDFPQPGFTAVQADLSSAQAARTMVASVIASFGSIDFLVHLMGGFDGGRRVEDNEDAVWDRMMDINARSAFNLVRAVMPHMRKAGSGRIVAIGARTAVEPRATLSAYSASKAALVSLIRTVALEGKDAAITANVILPGMMDTPANRAADPSADFSKWVRPKTVAGLALWLCSDAAADVTGAAIPVYGKDL